ncbi:MAG: DUF4159 domain-containing protein [Gemmatimonadales bacterium]|nr:DUF4159 domain-containing protein [Gemmatimonadales bacterium]
MARGTGDDAPGFSSARPPVRPPALTRRALVRATLLGAAAVALDARAEAVARVFGARRREFTFTRLQYTSGNWDVDQRMPANLLHALAEYTTVPIAERERVVPLGSPRVFEAPFAYMAGHRLVQFSRQERANFVRLVTHGGFVFADDCNHDIDGLFAKSFEEEMRRCFGPGALVKLPNTHPLYSAFFRFPDGPPPTALELNGWGDDLVHDHLKGVVLDGRLAVLYSNKDYGCEWDYDFRNKRFLAEDNTKFGVNIVLHAMTATA